MFFKIGDSRGELMIELSMGWSWNERAVFCLISTNKGSLGEDPGAYLLPGLPLGETSDLFGWIYLAGLVICLFYC